MVMPLLKGGDPSDLKLSPCFYTGFESLVSDQIKVLFLNTFQEGFRAGHSTITAATLITIII